jgi:hypothetical protein
MLLMRIIPAKILFMPVASPKPRSKKDNMIVADATDRLLRATKEKLLGEKSQIDYEKLAQQGYSRELIARLKKL